MQRVTGLPEEQVLAYEAQAELAMRAALQDVADQIAKRIEAAMPVLASVLVAADPEPPPPGQPYVSPDDLASIPPLWQQAVEQQIIPVVAQVFMDAVGRTHANMVDASSIANLPSVGSLAAEQYLAQAQNTFEQIGDDLWAHARTGLQDGFEQGESIPDLAERVRQSANVTARTAVLVARTQVNEASNAGSFAVAQASGLQMQKEWIATPDLRTRPTHLAADGQRVALTDPFIVGGFSAMFPAAPSLPPSERYNCRCTIGYVMPDRAPAQVKANDLQTQELADLPGTTPTTLAKAAEPGPEIDLPAYGHNLPSYVRPSLRDAKTPRQLRKAWQDEVQGITGYPFFVDAMPRGISMATAREYAEGTLQMFAQFPAARIDRIHWFDDAAGPYAHVRSGAHAIEFNMRYATETARPKLLAARRKDVAGWDGPQGLGWSVRGDVPAQGIVYHEFIHIVDEENLRRAIHGEIVPLLIRHAQREGVTDIDDLIKRRISSYATENYHEMIAEAATDVMVNGAAASALSRDIFDLLRAEYRRRGFAIRTAPIDELAAEAERFGKAAAPHALSAQTVAQLRALAKERGIAIPAGARKADLVKALEGAPVGEARAAMPSLEVRTSLSAAEQTRVRTLVRRDPQIFATVQDRFGPISSSGNLSDADAAWLETVYKRDRAFVERVAQEAEIKRTITTEAKKLGITPTQYRVRESERLKELLDGKSVAVRVRDDAALRDILSSGQFRTSIEGVKRAAGLVSAPERRQLGEAIMGVDQPPIYGYVAIRGVEPALSAGRKIAGLTEREGQEDILSAYGQIQVVLKSDVRTHTTVTVGDSLDEIGLVRPSPIDNPSAESIGTARRLEAAITEPGWTRSRYVEAQIHGGVRREDIAEVVFPETPAAATAKALQDAGIPWRVLRRGDTPIPPAPTAAPLDEKAVLRAAARERNRLIESSQGTAKLLAELDELIANKATKAALRQRLDPALIAPEQVYAGADPAVVEALRKALDTGDPAKLRSALTRAGTKTKLKPIGKAGAKAKFDPETMEGVGGIDIAADAQVTVVRRGTTLTLPDGSTLQLTRAQVTPIAPKPAPIKAATRRATAVKSELPSRAPAEIQARQAQLREIAARPVIKDEQVYGGESAFVRKLEHEGGPPTITKDTTRIGKGAAAKRDADAEELGSLTAEAVGIRAPTVIRIGPSKIEMEFLEGKAGGGPAFAAPRGGWEETDDGRLMGLLDYLTGNPDRSDRNWLLMSNGRMASIDMGDAFRAPKLTGTRDSFGSSLMLDEDTGKLAKIIEVNPADLVVIRTRLEALAPEFDRLGRGTWHRQVMARLAEVEKRADPTAPIRLAEARPDLATIRRAAMGDEQVKATGRLRSLIAQRPKSVEPLSGGNVAENQLVTYSDGTKLVHKTYSSFDAVQSGDAEVLGARLAQATGVRAPAVTLDPTDGSVWMEFMQGKSGIHIVDPDTHAIPEELLRSAQGRRLGIADAMMGGGDRSNPGNWLRTSDGHLVALDHGAAFADGGGDIVGPGPFGHQFLVPTKYGQDRLRPSSITRAEYDDIRPKVEALRSEFEALGRLDWYDTALRRLDLMAGIQPVPLTAKAAQRAAARAQTASALREVFMGCWRCFSDDHDTNQCHLTYHQVS